MQETTCIVCWGDERGLNNGWWCGSVKDAHKRYPWDHQRCPQCYGTGTMKDRSQRYSTGDSVTIDGTVNGTVNQIDTAERKVIVDISGLGGHIRTKVMDLDTFHNLHASSNLLDEPPLAVDHPLNLSRSFTSNGENIVVQEPVVDGWRALWDGDCKYFMDKVLETSDKMESRGRNIISWDNWRARGDHILFPAANVLLK